MKKDNHTYTHENGKGKKNKQTGGVGCRMKEALPVRGFGLASAEETWWDCAASPNRRRIAAPERSCEALTSITSYPRPSAHLSRAGEVVAGEQGRGGGRRRRRGGGGDGRTRKRVGRDTGGT